MSKAAALYPLTFQPIFKERIWGGRKLDQLYHKPLPPAVLIGESWEITDRPEGVSVIANGPLAGKDLRWLMEQHASRLLGKSPPQNGRFPLLIKILDAQEVLSLQVHPPPAVARRLGGEPKTEMWYIAEATPEAELFVGLRKGTTRAEFEQKLAHGTVATCLHRVRVQRGDVMFLPSGRLHAVGAGCVLFEVQQNSDTTYRVFDWNRVGLDGRPRELHVEQSLACIDFTDCEPDLVRSRYSRNETLKVRYLVDHPLFRVDSCQLKRGGRFHLRSDSVQILGLIRGRANLSGGGESVPVAAGQFVLIPACLERTTVEAETQTEFLHIQAGLGKAP